MTAYLQEMGVYKVQTIGDAYIAVTGMIPTSAQARTHPPTTPPAPPADGPILRNL